MKTLPESDPVAETEYPLPVRLRGAREKDLPLRAALLQRRVLCGEGLGDDGRAVGLAGDVHVHWVQRLKLRALEFKNPCLLLRVFSLSP